MKSTSILLLSLTLASVAVAQTSTTTKPATSAAKKPAAATSSATKKPGTSTAAKKPATTAPVTTLKDTKEKFSYALGLSLGTNLHRQDVDIDPSVVAQGLKDALNDNSKHLLTDQEAQAVLTQMQGEVREKAMAKAKESEGKNKAAGV